MQGQVQQQGDFGLVKGDFGLVSRWSASVTSCVQVVCPLCRELAHVRVDCTVLARLVACVAAGTMWDMTREPGREAGTDRWRPLTSDEHAQVAEALVGEWAGAAALRTQLEHLQARPGCRCGCGTLDLQAPSGEAALDASSPMPREGVVLDAQGAEVGGLLLFLTGGRLASLEVYCFGAHWHCPLRAGPAGTPRLRRENASCPRNRPTPARALLGRGRGRHDPMDAAVSGLW